MNLKLVYLLLQLKNIAQIRKEFSIVKYYNIFNLILSVLYNEGYIQSYKLLKKEKTFYLLILFRNNYNNSLFEKLKIIFKKNKQYKINNYKLSNLQTKNLNLFLSTNLGILSLIQCKKYKIGGKAFFIC